VTKETRKRLYNHYKESGNSAALSDLVSKYPELEKPKAKPKAEKEDGKKPEG
jgi:hypothetical protein|tara:strand:+ start:2105 stop:2260 length:156 start_codon:yes stop_codon:yes gene_type:complete